MAALVEDQKNPSKMFGPSTNFDEFEVREPQVRSTEVASSGGPWAPRFSFLCSAEFRRNGVAASGEEASADNETKNTAEWEESLQVTRTDDDFRCLRASLVEKYSGVILGPLPEVCHIMRKYYKNGQIIASTQRDYESFVKSCLNLEGVKVDPEFKSFVLLGQADWQTHFKKSLSPLDFGSIRGGGSIFQSGEIEGQAGGGASQAQLELLRYQHFLTTTESHCKELINRSVELIERGQPAMSESKDLVVGARSTGAVMMASMLGELEAVRGLAISEGSYYRGASDTSDAGGADESEAAADVDAVESAYRKMSGAWFGFKEKARQDGQGKHIALLGLYFEAQRVYRWVQAALENMKCGAGLFRELKERQKAHTDATESLRKRGVHEKAHRENEEQVEDGEGGLATLAMTYFHGLSALSQVTETQCQQAKEAVEVAHHNYEKWEERSVATVKTVCDSISLAIEEVTHRFVAMERDRYTAHASVLTEMAKLTVPAALEGSAAEELSIFDKMMSAAAVEATQSEVWHD